jgi:hypothetical protein
LRTRNCYFEITILKPKDQTVSNSDEPLKRDDENSNLAISVGFIGEFCNQQYSHVGWNAWSVGYHGDNGEIYENSNYGVHDSKRTFGIGNTVGCGINYSEGMYFFTLNGMVVGKSS